MGVRENDINIFMAIDLIGIRRKVYWCIKNKFSYFKMVFWGSINFIGYLYYYRKYLGEMIDLFYYELFFGFLIRIGKIEVKVELVVFLISFFL